MPSHQPKRQAEREAQRRAAESPLQRERRRRVWETDEDSKYAGAVVEEGLSCILTGNPKFKTRTPKCLPGVLLVRCERTHLTDFGLGVMRPVINLPVFDISEIKLVGVVAVCLAMLFCLLVTIMAVGLECTRLHRRNTRIREREFAADYSERNGLVPPPCELGAYINEKGTQRYDGTRQSLTLVCRKRAEAGGLYRRRLLLGKVPYWWNIVKTRNLWSAPFYTTADSATRALRSCVLIAAVTADGMLINALTFIPI
eukprot:Hpha_TRINITY_DN14089_c0_g1::TRINITY_DN14089_c0_g1_i2::g.44052::m.44052